MGDADGVVDEEELAECFEELGAECWVLVSGACVRRSLFRGGNEDN